MPLERALGQCKQTSCFSAPVYVLDDIASPASRNPAETIQVFVYKEDRSDVFGKHLQDRSVLGVIIVVYRPRYSQYLASGWLDGDVPRQTAHMEKTRLFGSPATEPHRKLVFDFHFIASIIRLPISTFVA